MLNTSGRGILALCVLGCVLACAPSDEGDMPDTKEAAVRELLELTNAADIGKQVMDQMGAAYSAQMGPEFGEYWERFTSRVDGDELTELLVPIYAKHFELSELHELIRFNRTPVGQKMMRVMPDIMQESMEVGAAWGQQLAMDAMAEFEDEEER